MKIRLAAAASEHVPDIIFLIRDVAAAARIRLLEKIVDGESIIPLMAASQNAFFATVSRSE